ncbi:hypothetical protein B0H14DRAFT_3502776 [Mycena olivaceomarginata]|nr:hypothetical protein B0H14DRAFT_3502776 [Mycena olivaceomarginata]
MQLKAPLLTHPRTSFTTNPKCHLLHSETPTSTSSYSAARSASSSAAQQHAYLSCHADNPNSWLSDLEQQNLVLCERLQRSSHYTGDIYARTSMGIVPPACAPSPAPPAPLRFITTTRALEMPALLVTLLLHRRECKDETGAGTRTFQYTAHMRSGERRSASASTSRCGVELRVGLVPSDADLIAVSIPRELRVNPVHPASPCWLASTHQDRHHLISVSHRAPRPKSGPHSSRDTP